MFLSNNPSLGDINSLNLSCLSKLVAIIFAAFKLFIVLVGFSFTNFVM